MNDLDKEIKKVITKEITLSEDFKSSVRNTIEDCFQNSKTTRKRLANQNTVEHKIFNVIKKIITAILIGASTITVYAATTRNFDFSRLGLMKLDENYNESIVEMNQSVENDYAKITLNSMAGDESYIITEYRINLKDTAINEYGEVDYWDSVGYRLWISTDVFVDSNKITNKTSNVTKISNREFVYTEIINIMNFNEKNLDIKIHIGSFNINNSDNIKIGKIIELKMNLKDEIKKEFIAQEQKISTNDKVIINSVGNTKFETYITAQKITENITYKEFKSRDAYKYNSFIVTNENDEEIPYTIRGSVWAGKYLYIKDENGNWILSSNHTANDDDIIKYVENFIILIGNQYNIEKVKIIPIETAIFNERTDEEINEYKKVKWYPLVEGDNKYSAKSSLGGTFEIVKTEINENDVTFYYETEGLLGNESEIIIRKKIKDMNYIYPIRTEKAGINGTENKIVFSKEVWMASGANTWKLDGMFDNINDVEFALMWGSRDKIIADSFTVDIPKQNNNIANFDIVEVYDSQQIIIECGFEKYAPGVQEYEISYDKDNKVLSVNSNLEYIVKVNEECYNDITSFIETVKKYYIDRGGICNVVQEEV